MHHAMKRLPVLIACFFVAACADRRTEIEKALKQYDRLTFKMDADSLADMYVPNGKLGGKTMKSAVSRDSIRQFMKSFDPSKITLISNHVTATLIAFKGDTAVVDGSYEQKAKLGSDTGVYTGNFASKWVKDKDRWLIATMYTTPTKPLATIKSVLLRQLKSTHTEKDWFVPANIAVEGLTAKQAMWTDGSGNHSAGQLATHLIFWNERLLKSFKGEPNAKFSGNNDETFNNSFDEKSWGDTVKKLDEVLSAWEREIKNADETRLNDWYENIANMNTHNAYHTGQVIFLRKLQGSWNPEKGVK
jgi:ketosteroid isomerase-like protein